MSMTQFAMVEELAFLVKDNLPCKHLVLSVEEALVNFLETDTSSCGILELEPMNSYNRLLMHRLADIFGFSHESVGEGDDRHLILERCPETSVPSILVSDILGQYDEPQSPTTSHQLLRRTDASPVSLVSKTQSPLVPHSLEEREAAYLAARERIFSLDLGGEKEPVRPKPRSVPVVARRMIAHALGQRITSCNHDTTHKDSSSSEGQTHELNIEGKDKTESDSSLQGYQEIVHLSGKSTSLYSKERKNYHGTGASSPSDTKAPQKLSEKISTSIARNGMNREHYKREHLGAAKRMFAHALGMQAGVSKSSELKQ
ncbi:R3H domain-containing protein 2 [Morus notabilis]|uniref:R3H domain-containing protein 2 n=1 Tax=Morus notabilis TaxID=981085 RepID=W9S6Y8_9ROSA|nr:R3H domain-containing protein 2 [Morus notabilis]EXC29913.1 R3H domain-containing protein 2 [Morus notabilis]